jgi:hypothetical protein
VYPFSINFIIFIRAKTLDYHVLLKVAEKGYTPYTLHPKPFIYINEL